MRRSLPLIAFVLTLAACSRPAADASAPAPDAAGPSAAADSGNQGAQWPGPAFAPRYAGASDESWGMLGPHRGNASFSTTDSPERVRDFYTHAGQAAGLQPRDTSSDPGLVYSGAGPAGEITVTAAVLAGLTHVTLNWSTGT